MTDASEHALSATRVFDGATVHENAAAVIRDGRIADIVAHADLPRSIPTRILPEGTWLAPGFVDLQVNGGGDVLFNNEPNVDGLRAIAAAHRNFGTTALLPTLITDRPELTPIAIAAVQAAMDCDPGIVGLHLEGPFLSPDRPGVHDPRWIRRPTANDLAALKATQKGAVLVTLAPEAVPAGFIAELAAAGVCVALGHSMATYAQTRAAMGEGLRGFTHLFNAMRPLASREPGPIAAALESPHAWYGLIVDGVHVDPAMLRLALRGLGRPVLVTDAMPPVGGARAEFQLYGETIAAHEGRCARADGALAGSVLDMATAVRNCVRLLGVPLPEALRFASLNPATAIGLAPRHGKLAPGSCADLVALDPDAIEIIGVWVAGREI